MSTLTGGPELSRRRGPDEPGGCRATDLGGKRIGRHADRVGLADRKVVEPGDRDIARNANSAVEQFQDQPERGVILVADNTVGGLGPDVVGQFRVGILVGEARWLLQDKRTPAGLRWCSEAR